MARPSPCQNSGKTSMPDNTTKAVDSMGKVTEELVTLITKQIQDHGIVVWYDPEQAYSDVVDQCIFPRPLCCAIRRASSPFATAWSRSWSA